MIQKQLILYHYDDIIGQKINLLSSNPAKLKEKLKLFFSPTSFLGQILNWYQKLSSQKFTFFRHGVPGFVKRSRSEPHTVSLSKNPLFQKLEAGFMGFLRHENLKNRAFSRGSGVI